MQAIGAVSCYVCMGIGFLVMTKGKPVLGGIIMFAPYLIALAF